MPVHLKEFLKPYSSNWNKKAYGIGLSYYPLRIVGYIFADVILISHGTSFGFSSLDHYSIPWFFIYPHFCFVLYKLSGSNKSVELFFLLMDTFWAGVFIASMHFSFFPSIVFFLMTCWGNIGVRGIRQFLYGLPSIGLGIGFAALFIPIYFKDESNLAVMIICSVTVMIYTLYFVYTAYLSTIYQRKLKKELAEEKRRAEELLLNILPRSIAEELMATGQTSAQSYDLATVMFADVKDFTIISERLSPQELVSAIDFYFTEFDKIINRYNIEKIKTVGDAYVCAGGLPQQFTDNAIQVVTAAEEIASKIDALNKERITAGLPVFQFRFGIHSGPLVAGVVGLRKFAYDIWGDTVNTAARLEQNSEPGKINISHNTWQFVQHHFDCDYRGEIPAKNKGSLKMYFLNAPKN